MNYFDLSTRQSEVQKYLKDLPSFTPPLPEVGSKSLMVVLSCSLFLTRNERFGTGGRDPEGS